MSENKKSVKNLFGKLGGRASVVLMLKTVGFKPYASLLANWEKSNTIPPAWLVAFETASDHFKFKEFKEILELKGEVRKAPGAYSRYTDTPLYIFIKDVYGSIDKFVNGVNERNKRALALGHETMPLHLNRPMVYEWLKKGFIPGGKARALIRLENFPTFVLENPFRIPDDWYPGMTAKPSGLYANAIATPPKSNAGKTTNESAHSESTIVLDENDELIEADGLADDDINPEDLF